MLIWNHWLTRQTSQSIKQWSVSIGWTIHVQRVKIALFSILWLMKRDLSARFMKSLDSVQKLMSVNTSMSKEKSVHISKKDFASKEEVVNLPIRES